MKPLDLADGLLDRAETLPPPALRPLFLRLLADTWSLADNLRLMALYRRYDEALQAGPSRAEGALAAWDSLDASQATIGLLGSLAAPNNTSKFLIPLLPYLKDRGFRLSYYSTCQALPGDPVQREVARTMDSVAWVQKLPPQQVARRVFDDGCAILIDLDGHSYFSKTEAFVARPAPVQMCWCNWPSTLGLASADYFLGDRYLIPPQPGLLSEIPIAMDVPFGCFTPMAEVPVAPEPPCARNGYVTFGSTAKAYKLNSRLIALWSEVLARAPTAKFRVVRHECRDVAFRAAVAAEFQRRGIAPERIEFFDFPAAGLNHLQAYGTLDICLDSAPFGGATTAADCLWMGVPMITLVGPGVHQRLSYSMLGAIGAEELACTDESAYVARACELAADPARIRHYRATLRARFSASPLRDPKAVADGVIAALQFALDDTRRRRAPAGPASHGA
ncbi:MAG: hypothetical protein HZA64_12265 [Rhodocyclales bacterium]|nr:hypothetical protein [Rhodocyclales bacterium]